MKKQIQVSILFTAISTIALGIIYPTLLAGIQLLIPTRSSPSLLIHPIQRADLFQGRPSSSGGPYSGASNLSFTSQKLAQEVNERLKTLTEEAPGVSVPHDLLFASASGYDPYISVHAALFQIPRIAKARNWEKSILEKLVKKHTQSEKWGFIGNEKVNVVELNKDIKDVRP
jgi:K+-transporting ATPase ATPase C chain